MYDSQVSWCKLEVEVVSPKNIITTSAEAQNQEVPPLVVAALNLKTRFNAQVTHSWHMKAHVVSGCSCVTCCLL